jgi:hypothetical protein
MPWKYSVISSTVMLAMLLVPIMGCHTSTLRIRLGAFRQGDVDGVWLWKYQPRHGRYVRSCRIDISNAHRRGGREVVSYQQRCRDRRPQAPAWVADVKRVRTAPHTVELTFVYQRYGAPARYKATAFNRAGESALSRTAVRL